MNPYLSMKSMPPELLAQDDALHQEQLNALDRYDFEAALVLSQQQRILRENWYNLCIQETICSKAV